MEPRRHLDGPDDLPSDDPTAHHTGPCGPAVGWEGFHDRLDTAVGHLGDGDRIDLVGAGSRWRMRISAGWPGVDGPGTLAYHMQLGGEDRGAFGPWAATPYARGHGYEATRVAGEVSALGLESDPTGIANPSMIASGGAAHLEVADLAMELLRETFAVTHPASVRLLHDCDDSVLDGPYDPGGTEAPPGAHWWDAIDFDSGPESGLHPDAVVGPVDGVLVEVTRDAASLPGLSLLVARARLTEPDAAPLALPTGDAAALLRWMRSAGGDGISVDTVRSSGGTLHGWATRILCSDGDATGLARIGALDGPAGDEQAAAAAAADVVAFVRSARRSQPEVLHPTRLPMDPRD